jgi:signal transduction histidine kinase
LSPKESQCHARDDDVERPDAVWGDDALVGEHAREKGLTFDIFFKFPVPRKIITDPTRLKQILINLCDNARKFTETGGISIDVANLEHSRQMSFTVTDTGIGMSHQEMGNIFKAFTQADTSTIRKYGGTGLGLCISQQLAQKLAVISAATVKRERVASLS